MASVYDLARIRSGDPMEKVRGRAAEASALLAQYKKQKDIVDEINEAIKDAEKKANKNKEGYGIAGSLLGGLLGAGLTAATGGLGATALSPYMSTLGAALGSGVAEKYRQDRTGATNKLKKLEERLEGTKRGEQVEDIRKGIDESLDKILESGMLNAITMDLITPAITGSKTGFVAGEPVDSMSGAVEGVRTATPSQAYNIPTTNIMGIDIPISDAAADNFAKKSSFGQNILEGTQLSKLIPKEILNNEFLQKPLINNLIRILGPQLMMPSMPGVGRLERPTFRNPYGGF